MGAIDPKGGRAGHSSPRQRQAVAGAGGHEFLPHLGRVQGNADVGSEVKADESRLAGGPAAVGKKAPSLLTFAGVPARLRLGTLSSKPRPRGRNQDRLLRPRCALPSLL
jgi:hypothetical protein